MFFFEAYSLLYEKYVTKHCGKQARHSYLELNMNVV